MLRTKTCGELRKTDSGKEVVLAGWVHKVRTHGNVTFLDIRDRYGTTQVVCGDEFKNSAAHLSRESVVQIKGTVVEKPEPNKNLETGEIEVNTTKLTILNKSAPLPLELDDTEGVTEDTRLKYRFLDLRRKEMQDSLILRHTAIKTTRDFFDKNNFIEIETPVLTKSTPEGARDYLVPSRVHQGKFFALPQSPQIFKQILMVSGFDKYMQIVKCFRDEDLRADRQPEFTQIDLEMSFVDEEDIYSIIDNFIKHLWKEVMKKEVTLPFPKITYHDSMSRFGTDRPDTRFSLELSDITEIFKNSEFKVFSDTVKENGLIKGITAPGCAEFSRKEIDALTEKAKEFGAKGLVALKLTKKIEGPIAKFLSNEEKESLVKASGAKKGDLILIAADKKHNIANESLGALRTLLGKKLNLYSDDDFNFIWVTDFPLLEFDHEEQRHVAVHHPFTSPKDEDLALLDSKPGKARAKAYDIVLNGVEIGGGSIRIHNNEIQQKIFSLLNISEEEAKMKFGFLLDALKYGAPPHGGIAFGMDRLAMLMAGKDSIREVIAFPKNKNCVSLMDNAPNEVDSKQLDELGIKKKN